MDKGRIAEEMAYNAYQMYTGKADPFAKEPFPMYSYERPANIFWRCVVEQLLENGLTKDQAKAYIKSKDVRHLLDKHEDKLAALAKEIVKGVLI